GLSTSAESSEDSEFTVPESAAASIDSTAQTKNSTSQQSSSVHIKTDVLDLYLDLKGGNVISAKMPQHKVSLGSEEALALLESGNGRHYVVESGLFGKNGYDSSKNGPAPIYSSSSSSYELQEGQDSLSIDLNFESDDGVSITKRYEFKRNDYLINVSYIINNKTNDNWQANLSGKIVRDRSSDPSSQNSMGMQSFLGMALSSAEKPYEKYDFEDMLDSPINEQIHGGWVAFIQHYFLSAWIPDNGVTHTYQTRVKGGRYLMGFISPAIEVAPGETKTTSAQLYIGPKIMERLEAIAPNLDLTVDFGWLFWVATPLFLLLDFFYGIVLNWGFAIILVT
ncbi:membrane protein insertase YidC, partial [Oleiphilus sp. HI0061]